MKTKIYYFVCLSAISQISLAQKHFKEKDLSNRYTVAITVKSCEGNTCSGPGTIRITDKANAANSQLLKSEDLYFDTKEGDAKAIKRTSQFKKQDGTIEIYKEIMPVSFDDYNFDGNEDVAIRNGNNSGYGGPSFDIYVYNISKKQFLLSKELTELASTNLGMFQLDKAKKRIITSSKDGCCWHSTREYEVVFRKGLQLVHETIEDATVNEGENVLVTDKKLVNGQWQSVKKKYKTKEYYKE